MQGKIQIACGPMLVLSYDEITGIPFPKGLKQAQELPCQGSLEMDDGQVLYFDITFPKTYVRKKKWNWWIVDPCTTKNGKGFEIESIVVSLPKEDCLLHFSIFKPWIWMVAQKVQSVGEGSYVKMKDGRVGAIQMIFPDAPSYPVQGFRDWLVGPVLGEGVVVF